MTAATASICYRFAHFDLQPSERRLLASGKAIHLGPHAFDLLVALAERSGHLVSKDELLVRVWGKVVVEENTLQTHISTLRKVLSPDSIATISGRGYRFTLEVIPVNAPSAPVNTSAPASKHNLPHDLTSFIGREKEIAEIAELLGRSRLLTMTGAGGCGKTRLAIELAKQHAHAYPDGARLVELASLTDATLLPQAVADVLGIKQKPDATMIDTVGEYLEPRALLLVLDNAEHLIEPCAKIVESLLRRCPRLVVLATSRERLRIAGEQTYRVPSLAVPDEQIDATPESIAAYESARLFIERARLLQPHFAITAQNAAAVASICRRLDGIALALELAAPRVLTMSVEDVSRRLDQRFDLLTEGSRTVLPRHRTLRALIDWSYDLLTDAEKVVLRQLSVFAGGWTLDAAQHVCFIYSAASEETLEVLTSLTDKNLVIAEARDGTTRYALLETVRDYARDRLRESSEETQAQRRHLAYYRAMTDEVHRRSPGTSHNWLDRVETELDNMRAALSWAAGPDADAAGGLRLAGELLWLWQVRGYFSEGRSWLVRLLALVPVDMDQTGRAKALRAAAVLAARQDDNAAAEDFAEEALALYRELGDRRGIAEALQCLGYAAKERGDFAAARALQEDGLDIRREIGDPAGTASALMSVAAVAFSEGDLPGARAMLEESAAIDRGLGDWRLAYPLALLGLLHFCERDYPLAKARLTEALRIQRDVGIRSGAASALTTLGMVAHDESDYEHAAASLREALTILRDLGSPDYVCEALEAFGAVARVTHGAETAARIWGAAERLREEIHTTMMSGKRPWYEIQVAAARAGSGDGAFDPAWNEGRAMTLDQAISFAMSVGPVGPARDRP